MTLVDTMPKTRGPRRARIGARAAYSALRSRVFLSLLFLMLLTEVRSSAMGHPLAPPAAGMDLFTAGHADTQGLTYSCFRIPALVRTKQAAAGHVLAFAEGRRGSCSDQGDVRIVVRASTDDGATWSPIRQVLNETGHTIGNPAPVVDATTGVLWLLYTRDDNEVFVTSSQDGGATWGASKNITAQTKPSVQPKSWVATGPGGTAQLATGRLVAAAYYNQACAAANACSVTRAYTIYSDDRGTSWTHGEDVGINSTPGAAVYGGGESQVVKFGPANGLAMLIRARTTVSMNVDHNHALAFSHDGGVTWSNSTRISGINTVYCQGSLAAASNGDLIIASPSTRNGVRANLTVWAAPKASPASFKYVATVYRGSSAYSSMLAAQVEGAYMILYERENSKFISLARFQYPKRR